MLSQTRSTTSQLFHYGTSYLESQVTQTVNQGQSYTINGLMKTSYITATSGNNGIESSVISAPYAFTYTANGLPNTVNVDGQSFSMIYDDGNKLINRNNSTKPKQ